MKFLTKKTFLLIKKNNRSSRFIKTFNTFDLILFIFSGIIGIIAFILVGIIAIAEPIIILSYIIAGLTCIFIAFDCIKFLTILPISRNIYNVGFGEIFACIIVSVLFSALIFKAAIVSAGWSEHVQNILAYANYILAESINGILSDGSYINLLTIFIIGFVSLILFLATKYSKHLNAILIFIRLIAIFSFIITAILCFDLNNRQDFISFSFDKIKYESTILLLAFSDFGNIAIATEDCKSLIRDIIIGIIGSLIFLTMVYVITTLLTGSISYYGLDNIQLLTHILNFSDSKIGLSIIAIGAVYNMTRVVMNISEQSRIFYIITREELISSIFTKIYPKCQNLHIAIIIFDCTAAIVGAFFSLKVLGQLFSTRKLINYIIISVMIFKIELFLTHRLFECTRLFIISSIASVCCVDLLSTQTWNNEVDFLITNKLVVSRITIVIASYFIFLSYKKSKLI